jgi:hypothetical protein
MVFSFCVRRSAAGVDVNKAVKPSGSLPKPLSNIIFLALNILFSSSLTKNNPPVILWCFNFLFS